MCIEKRPGGLSHWLVANEFKLRHFQAQLVNHIPGVLPAVILRAVVILLCAFGFIGKGEDTRDDRPPASFCAERVCPR